MQREDVYETNDLPESDQSSALQEENFDSEHIEKVRLKVGDAYQVFKNKSLRTDDVDFSCSVAKNRKGYGGESFFVELIRPVGGEPETLVQQYNRLQNEICELAVKLEEMKIKDKVLSEAESKMNVVTAKDISEIQSNLKQLQVEQVLGAKATENIVTYQSSLFSQVVESIERAKSSQKEQKAASATATKPVTYELFCSPFVENGDKKHELDAKKVAALETRFAALEKLVGNDSEKLSSLMADTKTKNLLELAENLQQKVGILDSTQLDLVDARLSIILHKLSQVKDKKSSLDAEQNGRVNELYEMMNKWDALCSSLPHIVSRLQSLKELHEQAMQFSQCITYLDGVQQELNKALDNDVALLNEVKDTFAKNLDVFKSNLVNVESRLKALSTGRP